MISDPSRDPDEAQSEVDAAIERADDLAEQAMADRLAAQATVMEGRRRMEAQRH